MKLGVRTTIAALAAIGTIGGLGIGTATASETGRARPASAARPLESPGPDCADNGNVNPCYEYQTWFWTFDNCNKYAYSHPYDRNRYDRHVCAVFSGGTTVGLWFHKIRG